MGVMLAKRGRGRPKWAKNKRQRSAWGKYWAIRHRCFEGIRYLLEHGQAMAETASAIRKRRSRMKQLAKAAWENPDLPVAGKETR
jgi:hypothetical protein